MSVGESEEIVLFLWIFLCCGAAEAEAGGAEPGVGSYSSKWGHPSPSYSKLPSPPMSPWAGTWVVHPADIKLSWRSVSTWIHEQFQIFFLFNHTQAKIIIMKKKKSNQRDKSLWCMDILPCLHFRVHRVLFLIGWGWRGKTWHWFLAKAWSRCRLAFRNYFCHKDECHPKRVGS